MSALLLAGCDNFREGVTLQPWQFESIAEPPSPDSVDGSTPIGTELVTAGSGPAVKAGDLVRLRYWRTVIQADKTERASDTAEVWIWTGREPDPGMKLWGDFGSPELRTAVIGRRVGERFALRVRVKSREITAPPYAIAAPHSPRKGFNEFIGQYDALGVLTLAGGEFARGQQSWSTIEILASCPAKFGTRHGHMTQEGRVFNWFGTAWDDHRSGALKWAAIEADCPAPEGKVRFMLGPIYWREQPWVKGGLMAFQSTYSSKHPKSRYPEDYDFVTIGGKTLPTPGLK